MSVVISVFLAVCVLVGSFYISVLDSEIVNIIKAVVLLGALLTALSMLIHLALFGG